MATAVSKRQLTPEAILSQYDADDIKQHCRVRDDPVAFCRDVCGIDPHRKQVEFLQSPLEKLKTMLPWGRRSGKSQVVSTFLAWRLFAIAGYNCFVFAPSGEQSRTIFDGIASIYETSAYLQRYSEFTFKGNTIRVGGKKWNATCELVRTGLDGDLARGKGVKDGKGLIVFDEISTFLYPEIVTSTIKPYIATGGGMVLLSSPGEPDGWMHQTYLDWSEQQRLGNKRYKVIECTYEDVHHLDHDVIEDERRECEVKNRMWWFDREYLGKWTASEGTFFDRADVERCSKEQITTGGKGDIYIYALDPGLDRSPSVLLIARFNQISGRLEIVDCRSLVRSSNKYVDKKDGGHEQITEYEEIIDLVLELRKSKPIHSFYIDPATEKNIGERLKNSFAVNVIDCRIGGYNAKVTALSDLQRCLADKKIVFQDNRISSQLLEFCPEIDRQTQRFIFPDKGYDIISCLCMLSRYIGDRTITPFICQVATRERGDLW